MPSRTTQRSQRLPSHHCGFHSLRLGRPVSWVQGGREGLGGTASGGLHIAPYQAQLIPQCLCSYSCEGRALPLALGWLPPTFSQPACQLPFDLGPCSYLFLNKNPPDCKVRCHWNHTVCMGACMGAWLPAGTQKMLRVYRPTAQNLTLEC